MPLLTLSPEQRHDFVERNSNIVLEYRKKEVIRLTLPETLEGRGSQTLAVNAKHGLKDIVWNDAALVAAVGKVTGQGTDRAGWRITGRGTPQDVPR